MGQAQGLRRKVDSNPSVICVRFVEDKVVIEQACMRIKFIYRRASSGRTWQNVCSLSRQSTPNSTVWTGRMRGTTISHARPQITTRWTTYIYLPLSILVPIAEWLVTIYPRGYTVVPLGNASCDRQTFGTRLRNLHVWRRMSCDLQHSPHMYVKLFT
jgi:hypothetical protein